MIRSEDAPVNDAPPKRSARAMLGSVFGFDAFRPGQAEVVERLLAGRSVLAIFPTGGGKSLCYQLPALCLSGVTLVISPLIALMKDQIDFLTAKGLPAARYDSTLDAAQARAVLDDLRGGRLKLLYISPERLANERFLQNLRSVRISLLAVDEAHCISEWGHNFRPDYLKIAGLVRELDIPRVLALTATADPATARDIARVFAIDTGDVVNTGFHRPNLELRATAVTPGSRRRTLLERLAARPRGATIVYVTLQKTAETVAEFLTRSGFKASAYHAGMENEARSAVQDAFMASDDLIVVATIAFGMGVDKAGIRAVYHYNLPKCVESYAQEIGRAGRDGRPAVCEALVCRQDTVVLENFVLGDTPDERSIAALLDEILDSGDQQDISVTTLSNSHDIRPLVARTLLTYLELAGVLRSKGHVYSSYLVEPLRPSAEFLPGFDAERQRFLRGVLGQLAKRRKYYSIDVDEAAAALGEPRERIVSALEYLHGQGHIALKTSGVKQRFQVFADGQDRGALTASLARRFNQRETRDVERVGRMLGLLSSPGCLTRELLRHFGEDLEADCGHCGPCLGDPPAHPEPLNVRRPKSQALERVRVLLEKRLPQLDTPRRMAKFLCGISSPATTRLKNHDDFGMFERVPFRMALELVNSMHNN